MIKLSHRLQSISDLITKPYDHIWDCCCDHGHLGMQLLIEQKAPNIHFVDIVPSLMSELEATLSQHFVAYNLGNQDSETTQQWHVHCMDMSQLPLADHKGKHLVVIAGVGGKLTQTLIEAVISNNPNISLDFLLCPVHQLFELREYLGKGDFSMIDEKLVEENRRFYEILHVTYQPASNELAGAHLHQHKVSPVGNKIWLPNSEQEQHVIEKYKQRTLQHYQRISFGLEKQGKPNSVAHIIEHYQAV